MSTVAPKDDGKQKLYTDDDNYMHHTRESDKESRCGIGSFHPEFLQIFNRIGAFIGIYSISGLISSSLSIYVNSQVPALEKQFGFSSTDTGLLMACNDIGYLSCVLFAGYIARRVHIPQGLGFSTIAFGISGILCALPYFLQDKSVYDLDDAAVTRAMNTSRGMSQKIPMCVLGNSSRLEDSVACDASKGLINEYDANQLWIKKVSFWVIAIGMVLQGIAKSPRYPFTTLYVDDNCDKRKTGFYMGILTGTGIFGPALAYLFGGLFSKMYVTLESVDIGPRDPRWVGAWWLGFLIFGCIAIVSGFPVSLFPRRLRGKHGNQDVENNEKPTNQKQQKSSSPEIKQKAVKEIKKFLSAMSRVIRNPVYFLLTVSTICNCLGIAGTIAFMPKYLASQYDIPLWQANIVMALSTVTAVALGSFLGGIMSRCFNMTPRTTIKLLVFFYLFNIAAMVSGFFLGCEQPKVVGGQALRRNLLPTPEFGIPEFETMPEYDTLIQSCVDDCRCDSTKYFPICGDDGLTYYSPCYAGCTDNTGTAFSNCTCIPSGRAVSGLCDQGCTTNLYIYACITFVGKLFTAFKIIPSFLFKLRCVQEKDRAVASAVGGFLYSALGWMLGPVIFGMLIDDSCTLWKYTCGERQSCQIYDIAHFRNTVHGYSTICTTVACLIASLIFVYLRCKGYTKWSELSGEEQQTTFQKNIKQDGIYKPISKEEEAKPSNGVN